LVVDFPPFMLDVVDSPAESPRYVATRNKQEPKAPIQQRENQTLRFGNRTIQFCRFRQQSGAPTALDDEASPPDKRRLDRR
jgi:hypothetical protein